ncbi:hypothetical protein HanIR_Chr17g0854341 [Helianthus annuus]|nr:hypothetical protein HanIR_Chr17g0854341 [Helianthus annuus]
MYNPQKAQSHLPRVKPLNLFPGSDLWGGLLNGSSLARNLRNPKNETKTW